MQLVINIDVDDLDKAVEFYVAALGLRPGRRLFEGSVAEKVLNPVIGKCMVLYLRKPDASAT